MKAWSTKRSRPANHEIAAAITSFNPTRVGDDSKHGYAEVAHFHCWLIDGVFARGVMRMPCRRREQRGPRSAAGLRRVARTARDNPDSPCAPAKSAYIQPHHVAHPAPVPSLLASLLLASLLLRVRAR